MLFEEPLCGAWRKRTLLIALVYVCYALAIFISVGYAIADRDAETAALAVIITVTALHFFTAIYAMFIQAGGRVSTQSDIANIVLVGDYLQAVGLGLAAGAVRRSGPELTTVIVSAVLVSLGQLVCFVKTGLFLSDRYEQDSGDRL